MRNISPHLLSLWTLSAALICSCKEEKPPEAPPPNQDIGPGGVAAPNAGAPGQLPPGATHALELIQALQEGRTDEVDELEIRDELLKLQAGDLSALKAEVDNGWDHANLHHLLYSDIDSPELRAEIIAHIQKNGGGERGFRVLSDIDDTVTATWIDERFPKDTLYPCVLSFYQEISGGGGPPPTFISARPGDRLGVVEELTLRSLKERGITRATLIAGGFTDLTSNEDIAERKFQNIKEYIELYPEYKFVFVGDSGQGDPLVAARLREELGERVPYAFIHDVVASDKGKEPLPAEERVAAAARGIYYFDSYLGAANYAFHAHLLVKESLAKMEGDCQKGLDAIAFEDEAMKTARQSELAAAKAKMPPR